VIGVIGEKMMNLIIVFTEKMVKNIEGKAD